MAKEEYEQKKKNLIVAKSNQLIQKSKINLTLTEQRVINYMIAKITPYDKQLDYIKIDYNDFCKIGNLKNTNFTFVKSIVKKLYDKSWEFYDGTSYVPIRWLDDYKVNENTIELKFHFRMEEFLLNLLDKKNFTQTELYIYFQFKNKYTSLLYDYFKSFANLAFRKKGENIKIQLTIDEIKKKLGLDKPNEKGVIKYQPYKDFRVKVIEPTVNEINTYTKLNIEYEVIKSGRKVTAITFNIRYKDITDRLRLEI